MTTTSAVARAFVEHRSASCHNARTDGHTYWLHGHPIAVQHDGHVEFDTCGWRTVTTRNHMNHICAAGGLKRHVSFRQRGGGPDTFGEMATWAKAAPQSPSGHKPPAARFVRYDAWRGHPVPALAVAGSSDCGLWPDSPAPSDKVQAELQRFIDEALKPLGIRATLKYRETSNLFTAKRWVMVSARDFERAAQAATNWLAKHERDMRYIHDAGLDELGYVPDEDADGHVSAGELATMPPYNC